MRVPAYSETVPVVMDDLGDEEELEVSFNWRAGSEPSGLSGPPENYDPGEADEFVLESVSRGGIEYKPSPREEEAILEWLSEKWERPEPDYPEPDYFERYLD